MKKLRVGIIGPGQIAQTAHIPNYVKRPNEVEVVALVGTSKHKANQIANQMDIPYAFDDVQEMLDTCDLDAVSICTPNKYHKEAAILALQAGCHVFCEKPPAISVQEAIEMEEAAKDFGKVLTFNLHYRHSSEVEMMKRFIGEGELGEIYSARVHALRRRGIPGWGVFTNKDIQGGGPLIDIGIHMLDVALYLMDYPQPESILAATHQRIGTKEGVGLMGDWDPVKFSVEDAAMGMIRFENGASLILETSFALNMKSKSKMNVELFGDKGGANVFPPTIYQEKHGALVDIDIPFLPDINKYEKAINDFIDSCIGKKEPLITARQGVMLQKIIHSFYQSAETGNAINFKKI
ncbi:Gfo/Idh/MocA family protein [Salirhabdus salicampi]|uniref:Gfo/Idh/MocA family protein n=1 Tax=Salirhabdus salicampi TaxID=476102 RepID=UPI0020C3867F|nr:Gfo/Idh/MocA family oxidoreductase [Salirhabdus salicampi]MCP8617873.1 Gfo/Idh/MocA family oxidoreductase [Salirhabdus salicampi]